MAPHSSTLAWKTPWMGEPGRLQSMGSLESDMTERLHFHFSLSCIGEGNGNPLQCSCLENPRDGEAWWAAVYGVTQSRTRLEWLSSSREIYRTFLFKIQNLSRDFSYLFLSLFSYHRIHCYQLPFTYLLSFYPLIVCKLREVGIFIYLVVVYLLFPSTKNINFLVQ